MGSFIIKFGPIIEDKSPFQARYGDEISQQNNINVTYALIRDLSGSEAHFKIVLDLQDLKLTFVVLDVLF